MLTPFLSFFFSIKERGLVLKGTIEACSFESINTRTIAYSKQAINTWPMQMIRKTSNALSPLDIGALLLIPMKMFIPWTPLKNGMILKNLPHGETY